MSHPNPFKWRHFEAEIILLCPGAGQTLSAASESLQ
jgi:hypothetical protein